jgi:hypothetical protein
MAKKRNRARDENASFADLDEVLDPKVFLDDLPPLDLSGLDEILPPLALDDILLPPLDFSALDDVLPSRDDYFTGAEARVAELETKLHQMGERLRYLASSVDPKELGHELQALARECENILERGTKAEEPRARRARRLSKR